MFSQHCRFCRGKNNLCNKKFTWESLNFSTNSNAQQNTMEFGPFMQSFFSMDTPWYVEEIPIIVSSDEDVYGENFVGFLSDATVLHIFSFLRMDELLNIRYVSKRWKAIAEDNHLWQLLNLSCSNIDATFFPKILCLPQFLKDKIKIVNLMWSYITTSSFCYLAKYFCNVDMLLLRHCRLVQDIELSTLNKRSDRKLNQNIKVLDMRNIYGSWASVLHNTFNFKHLKCLAFSETVSHEWINYLTNAKLPKLEILQIINNPSLSDSQLSKILNNSLNLRSLTIQSCMSIRGLFLKDLVNLTKLKLLDINSIKLSSVNLSLVDWRATQIESFNISFCCPLSEHDLRNILPNLNCVESLNMSFVGWGRALTDSVIKDMITRNNNFLSLQSVDLHSTFNISIKGLEMLLSSTYKLRNLRIGNLIRTKDDLVTILKTLPSIQNLSLQLSEALFEADFLFDMLSKYCPLLVTLFLYNIKFEPVCAELDSSLSKFFTRCLHVRNIFTGGYSYKLKENFDSIINKVTRQLEINVNTKHPKRAIPCDKLSFDKYLCNYFKARNYDTIGLKMALKKSINCQSFYKTGLDKISNSEYSSI